MVGDKVNYSGNRASNTNDFGNYIITNSIKQYSSVMYSIRKFRHNVIFSTKQMSNFQRLQINSITEKLKECIKNFAQKDDTEE